jgi:hypothetical protein
MNSDHFLKVAFFIMKNKTYYFTNDCHYNKFVYLIKLLLILKYSQPYSLINHITDSVVCFSNISNYPKTIGICYIFYITCILIYSFRSNK